MGRLSEPLTPLIQQTCIRQEGQILSNTHLSPYSMEMRISWNAAQTLPLPGQFLTILPHRYPLTLLRRPFAYSAVTESWFAFIYDIVGPTTRDLAKLTAKDYIDWIGPLGRSFPLPSSDAKPILVAGGAGVGPVFFLSNVLADRDVAHLVVIGARESKRLIRLEWPSCAEVRLCAEDGGAEITGTVIDGIGQQYMTDNVFYSCGPAPMMAAVNRLAAEHDSPSWVSVEEMMACGVGACQGCAVAVVGSGGQQEYKRVCDEGPVFASRDLIW